MINRSIKYLQELKDDDSLLRPASTLVSWLKMTGNQQGINSYLEMMTKPVIGKPRPRASTSGSSLVKDAAISANLVFSQANVEMQNNRPEKARDLLVELDQRIEPIGHTAFGIKVMAQLNICSLKSGDGFSHFKMMQVVNDWVALGYVYEALEHICLRVRLGVENAKYTTAEKELNQYLEVASSIIKGQMDIQLAETLGNLYEVFALAFLKIDNTETALGLLRDANQVYAQYGLRPRLAFNHLYQAKVTQLLRDREGQYSHLEKGLSSLKEATSLFRSIGHRGGVREAQYLLSQLRISEGFSQFQAPVTPRVNHERASTNKQNLLIECGLTITPLYRVYSAFVSKREQSVSRTLITKPFNQN